MGINTHSIILYNRIMFAVSSTTTQFASAKAQFKQTKKTQQKSNRNVVTRADWSLGSDVNNIVVFNTAALLFAGRFGFAPTVKKNYGGSTSYAMTEAAKPAVGSRDP